MKRYIPIFILCLCPAGIFAHDYYHRMQSAIDIGTHHDFFTYGDTRNTGDYTNDYRHLYYDDYTGEYYYSDFYAPARDIFYKLTLTRSMDIRVGHEGTSFPLGSMLYILDMHGNPIEHMEFSPSSSPFTFPLQAGTYYFVREAFTTAYNPDDIGTMGTTIETSARKTGEDFFYPFVLGPYDSDFTTSHVCGPEVGGFVYDFNPRDPAETYVPWSDFVYRFTITQPMEISLDNAGTTGVNPPNTFYQKLLSASLDSINELSMINRNLPSQKTTHELEAGTYFVYTRFRMYGFSGNNHTLTIEGTGAAPGSSFSTPLDIGNKSANFTHSHTQNTSLFKKGWFSDKPGHEVFYRVTLDAPMEITADNCGSAVTDTYLQVFDENRRLLYYNDDYSGEGACTDTRSARVKTDGLPPGTYYLVSDGASNGNITTTIKGVEVGPEGDRMSTAINAGTHESGFHFSDTRNTASGFSNQFSGKPTNDVFYKFTLTRPVDITVSHCGSAVTDTYMSVLDANGTVIHSNDNYTGEGKCANTGNAVIRVPNLPAGTYYVVSEGNTQNGEITTTIEAQSAFVGLNTTRGQLNIVAITPLEESDDLSALPLDKVSRSVQYYDNFGNPVLNVRPNASPFGGDLVTLQETDGLLRESKSWLPVVTAANGGVYTEPHHVKALATGAAGYDDQKPHGETIYDRSPLDLVVEQYGPGNDWHANGRSIRTERMTNLGTSGERACARYVIGGTPESPTFSKAGFYPNNELHVARVIDEDNNSTYEFTDKAGRTVLTRQMEGTTGYDTYYVHDHYGNLCFVLPPAAADALTATGTTWSESTPAVRDHAYTYRYDPRNRLTRKKLPGRDPVEMRYDKADRLVFSRDGNQRMRNEWTFFLHDTFGRLVLTGIWGASTVPDLTNKVVKAGYDPGRLELAGYGVNLELPGVVKLMTVNYYDDYRFLDMQMAAKKDSLAFSEETGYDTRFTGTKGLLTGSRTYRLDDPAKYSVAAMYHDHRGRVVQTRGLNHLGGYDKEYFAYTFSGKVKQRQLVHFAPGRGTQAEVYTYSYDHAERLLRVTHTLNEGDGVTLAQYIYDKEGRLKIKKFHESAETATYDYNIRGWLTRITGTRFNQTLAYNTAINGITPTKALFNGNISAMKWRSGDETTERGYRFSYDGLDRLTAAHYGEGASITANPDRFNELPAYDKMGNITTLQRRGKLDNGYGLIDDLTYTYTGNRLTKVSDAVTTPITYEGAFHFVDGANVANEYMYDANGNLTRDLNKNITSITYNSLNLPNVITFANGNTVTYGYDAVGSKLSVAYKAGSSIVKTEYAGNKIYKNGTLGMILTEEGYITPGTTPTYHYYLKDHQGNNRVVMDQAGTVLQVNHYYPFGGLFGEGIQDSNQPYRYSGKELDRQFGLDTYDFHWRQYMADLGRTTTPDPMSEKYYPISPYVYVANNPVRFIDPDGRMAVDHIDVEKNKDGTYTVVGGEANADKNIYVVNSEGNRTGEVVGEMLTEYSFHNNDGNAVVGVVIAPNDNSGQNFFNDEIKSIGLFEYMGNAKGGEPLDFKTTDMPEGLTREGETQYSYRGMSFNGKIASARDVGNYAAGYVAGKSGFGWNSSRFAFDALETKQVKGTTNTVLFYPFNRVREGQPSQQAQRAGHNSGFSIFKQRQFERQWQKATNPMLDRPKW